LGRQAQLAAEESTRAPLGKRPHDPRGALAHNRRMRVLPHPAAVPGAAPGTASLPRRVATIVAFVVAYIALDWVSLVDPYGPLAISPWNPPPGLALYLLLRHGTRMAPWLFVAAFAAEVLVRGAPGPWPLLAIASAWVAVGYVTMAAVLRLARFDGRLATLRDASVFVGTTVVSTLVIGSVFIGIFVLAGVVSPAALPRTVAQFWIGDVIGIVVTTPLLLALEHPPVTAGGGHRWEAVAQIAAIAAALYVVFGRQAGPQLTLFYLLFVPLVWVAMRRGVRGTMAAALLVQVALIAALQADRPPEAQVVDFQFLMLALALTGLFLAVAVAERHGAEQKLRDQQRELDRALRAASASELASTLAHELNQPLSAVASYTRACQLLLARGDPDGELPAAMDRVVAEANRAGMVMRRLREFVRGGVLHREPIEVAPLLASAVEAVAARTHQQRIDVVVAVPERLPPLHADRVQIGIVLHNLLTNAVDALESVDDRRLLEVRAADAGDGTIRIEVADNGPGVAPDRAPTLFEPLATGKVHGLGLGLAISRTIVEAHGGSLTLVPTAAGATFSLTIPLHR